MIEIRLPKPGPEIEEATITSWECTQGDKIRIGDILAIIKTPVGSFKVAAEEQGIMESILQSQGDSINFEEPIAMLKPDLKISDFKESEGTKEESLPFPEETEQEDESEGPVDEWEDEVIDLPEEPVKKEADSEEKIEIEEESEPENTPEEAETETHASESENQESDVEKEVVEPTADETIPFDVTENESPEVDEIPEATTEDEPELSDQEEETESQVTDSEEAGFPQSLEFEVSPAAMKLADQAGIDLESVQGSGENGKIHYIDVEHAIWERAKVNQTREQAENLSETKDQPIKQEQAPVPTDTETPGDEDITTEDTSTTTSEETSSADLQEIDEGVYDEQTFDDETIDEAQDSETQTDEEKPLPLFDDVSIQFNIERKDDLIIPFNTTKKNYAELMDQSNQSVPQLVLFAEIDFTNAGRWREVYNTENKTEISVTDMVVKTCGHALALMPEMNAYVRPDRIILKRSINIAITTTVEEGVVAPVVPDVYHKPLHKVSEAIRKNTSLAIQSKVVLDYDTAFTVSNLGMYGVKRFTPLVTPPQTACLAVGEIAKRVVPVKDFAGVREIVEVTLACDHRAVDGAAAAKFLQIIRDDLESMIPGEDPDWIKGNEQLRLI